MWARWLQILWPSFLMAGLMEILVFAMVDPADVRWRGAGSVVMSTSTVYSLAFLAFWAVIAAAAAMALYLAGATGPVAGATLHRRDSLPPV